MQDQVNIDIRGYGKIYKLAMRDRDLPLISKAIYAYLCSYAGSSVKAFPKREKIVRDLGINKDTFTKHLNLLVDEGYISKERTFPGNIYTIVQSVPRYSGQAPAAEEINTDMLIMENIQAQGFGTVPKLVMLDQRLSAQAKAIYSYFASFAGAGTTAFPRRTTVMRELAMTEKTYYKHFNQLLENGYLFVEQQKVNGKFHISIYRLADKVAKPSLPRMGEGNSKAGSAMSEKIPNGENGSVMPNMTRKTPSRKGMSEKLPHGGELLKTAEVSSEKGMSEKVPSEKILQEKTGRANIRNRDITNSSLEKEQSHNHQGGAAAEDKNPLRSFALDDVKRIIDYPKLLDGAIAWAELKELLRHFESIDEKERYKARAREIVDALTREIYKHLISDLHPDRTIAILQSDAFDEMVDELLNHWKTMRTVQGYVARSLSNLLRGTIGGGAGV